MGATRYSRPLLVLALLAALPALPACDATGFVFGTQPSEPSGGSHQAPDDHNPLLPDDEPGDEPGDGPGGEPDDGPDDPGDPDPDDENPGVGGGTDGANNLLPWEPHDSYQVTQAHNGGSHVGKGAWAWDFGMPVGTPIVASHFGTIRLVKKDSRGGGCDPAYANDANFVIVDQGNGYESLYLHLSAVAVSEGQRVARGDLIGYSGQTGWSCGPHLHFQIQLSPDKGAYGWYNQSIHDYFYDTGEAWDPPAGIRVESKNGVSNQP